MYVCDICPRGCAADRISKRGFCGAGERPVIARAAPHYFEEPPISGKNGSGAIFFCGCNLDCVFCQNHDINHTMKGREYTAHELAELMLALQSEGVHNINLVTPTPHWATVIPALEEARSHGLHIPTVCNTNGYELTAIIDRLDGLIDIYLPDLKYVSPDMAMRYSGAQDYPKAAMAAVKRMCAQAGRLVCDENGIAVRGVIVRHLVLPANIPETRRIVDFVADELPEGTYLSLMSQYVPCHRAAFPVDRRLTKAEYRRAVEYCISRGLENVFTQKLDSASTSFTPAFDGTVPDEHKMP